MRLTATQDRRLALALGLLALLIYNANLRLIAQGDSYPARFLPFALWGHGTLYLDPVREAATQGNSNPYWIIQTSDGHSASLYPVITPALVSPLYLPAVLYLRWSGWTEGRMDRTAAAMEKIAASIVAAVAVGWTYLLLRRRLQPRDGVLLTVAFAFGTNTWVIGSQALWQHGMAELLAVGALWFITGDPARANVLAAGLFTGLLAANRPPDALLSAALGAYALLWARRRVPLLALAAAVPVLLVVAYNLTVFEHPSGGYGVFVGPNFYKQPILKGVVGLLVSPGRGLFVFSPFLAFVPLLFARVLENRSARWLSLCLTAGLLLQIALYAKTDWRAGYSWGYRFLTDAVPFLVWLSAPVLASLGRRARAAFVACVLFSVWVQSVGAFRYQSLSDQILFDPADTERRNVWKIEASPILVESRQPLAVPPWVRRWQG